MKLTLSYLNAFETAGNFALFVGNLTHLFSVHKCENVCRISISYYIFTKRAIRLLLYNCYRRFEVITAVSMKIKVY